MVWPDEDEIKEAIVEPECILDGYTKRFKCDKKTKKRGKENISYLNYETGGFCIAFKMVDNNKNYLCFRIWTEETQGDLKDRLQLISNALQSYKLPYFVNFQFLQNALSVNDRALPGLRMDWVNGDTLGEFLKNTSSPSTFRKLANDFMTMCHTFKRLGIAHGDLSNANIFITSTNEIRLVDYDSIYVPSMGNRFMQFTGGLPGFQHPYRINNKEHLKASAHDDDFSQQIIYLSLLALSFNPGLQFYVGKDLLFTDNDFDSDRAFVNSRGYKAIAEIRNEEVQARLAELRKAVNGPLASVRSICDFEMPRLQKPASYCTVCGHQFTNETEHYCILCGTRRSNINFKSPL